MLQCQRGVQDIFITNVDHSGERIQTSCRYVLIFITTKHTGNIPRFSVKIPLLFQLDFACLRLLYFWREHKFFNRAISFSKHAPGTVGPRSSPHIFFQYLRRSRTSSLRTDLTYFATTISGTNTYTEWKYTSVEN